MRQTNNHGLLTIGIHLDFYKTSIRGCSLLSFLLARGKPLEQSVLGKEFVLTKSRSTQSALVKFLQDLLTLLWGITLGTSGFIS